MKMKRFMVLIRGESYYLNVENDVGFYGFFIRRLVEAEKEETAYHLAIESVRNEERLKKIIIETKSSHAKIFVEEIGELTENHETSQIPLNFIFFKEKRWWQFWQ